MFELKSSGKQQETYFLAGKKWAGFFQIKHVIYNIQRSQGAKTIN